MKGDRKRSEAGEPIRSGPYGTDAIHKSHGSHRSHSFATKRGPDLSPFTFHLSRFSRRSRRSRSFPALSPHYLQIRPRGQVAAGWIIALDPHLFQEPFALDLLTRDHLEFFH